MRCVKLSWVRRFMNGRREQITGCVGGCVRRRGGGRPLRGECEGVRRGHDCELCWADRWAERTERDQAKESVNEVRLSKSREPQRH